MKQKLSWMRNILPTLIEPGVMKLFGFDEKIPTLYAEIKDYADTADAYWQTVKLEPLYAPVAAGCNDLAPLLAIYDSARAIQVTSDGEYNQRQNEKVSAREAHHIIERKIFNWYAANYPDGQDQYWTQTPWGMAYTPAQPGEGEPVGTFPAKPSNMKAVKASEPLTGIMVSCDLLNGAATYNIYREKAAVGAPRPSRPTSPWMSGITDPAGLDGDVTVGFNFYYWMCGVNSENAEGAFSDAMMEWIG
jgi:hypothetical protein